MKFLSGLARLSLAGMALTACTLAGLGEQAPSESQVLRPEAHPRSPATFVLLAPQDTPAQAAIDLELVDLVTGVDYSADRLRMAPMGDGRWQVETNFPTGSLVRYRYALRSPQSAVESTARGNAVRYRTAYIPGQMHIEDVAATWGDSGYQGGTGRILGRILDAASQQPLGEIIVTAAGQVTFTNGLGEYRLDGLAPGKHLLVAYSPDGAYRPRQQEAIVAAASTTPAEFGLDPAPLVQLTFELTVPEDTPAGLPIRLAGNLRSLGAVFADLPGGVELSGARMPSMVPADQSHYILLAAAYAGTDLRYKYTLGDGLWSAERNAQGGFVTRQLIVPGEDLVIQEAVTRWQAAQGAPVHFELTAPAVGSDEVAIQLNPFHWFEPLPMARTAEGKWHFSLTGPLEFNGPLHYRFCRNLQCGAADDIDTAGPQAPGRQTEPGDEPAVIEDTVRAWRWWQAPPQPGSVVAPDLVARPGMELGVEWLPEHQPAWTRYDQRSLNTIVSAGANTLVLTPTWTLASHTPSPRIEFEPDRARFQADLKALADAAADRGLRIILSPALSPRQGDLEAWWISAPRHPAWWEQWFEAYRAFALSQALSARDLGAARLVLSGGQLRPAMPQGQLAGGAPSGVPVDAETRWRALIQEIRSIYTGSLAFELEYADEPQEPPAFLDAYDAVHIYWHTGISDSRQSSVEAMQAQAGAKLDDLLAQFPALEAHPLVLSVEYLSVDGAATGCARRPDGTCRDNAEFDLGRVVDPDLAVDLEEQAQAYNAVLLAAYYRPHIEGFFARRFNPVSALLDKSASVHGKPAGDVLWYWYPRLSGETR